MELSLDVKHRANVVDFVLKCREEYDRLLDEAPDIPSISIEAFLIQFADRENKPDVCNGLSIVVNDETNSIVSSKRVVNRWLNAFGQIKDRRRSMGLERSSIDVV
jgi:hypothetical protein